jgi:D-aminopeptidase
MTLALVFILQASLFAQNTMPENKRPRVREAGLKIGILPVGQLNSITDVDGVRVGHATLVRGENVRTGVTAILPHGGNLFQEKVPGAVFVGNGFGKLAGSTQVNELGEIETPILLTSTLSVPRVGDFLIDYMLGLPGNEAVQSINPLVAETNDGFLNDIRGRHVTRDDVFAALKNAQNRTVEEGALGAGTGTIAFGWKGGIGTASRRLPASLGGSTVGVLVQTNFGGVLSIDGAPVGQELGKYFLKDAIEKENETSSKNRPDLNDAADGSIIIVVARDERARAHRFGDDQRQRRLRDRVFDRAGRARQIGRKPARAKGSRQRRDVAAFPGRHRSDRGGDSQFSVSRNDDERQGKPRDRGFAARQDIGNPSPLQQNQMNPD